MMALTGLSGLSGESDSGAAYSPALDFSDARNSQYLAIIF